MFLFKRFLPCIIQQTKRTIAVAIVALLVGVNTPLAAQAAPLAAISVSGIVNSYAPVTNISGNVVTIGALAAGGASTPFAVNDYALLIQMTGIAPAHSGSNMGNYELLTVTAVSGSTITLSGITKSYAVATEAVQLVRVPYDATDITVTGTVLAKAWDGSTGGIVAMKGGTLTLNANIDASGAGFNDNNGPTTVTAGALATGAGGAGQGFPGAGDPTYFGQGGGGIGGGGGKFICRW
ncbi:hypothetical protein KFU94_48240 [Chloroflexi bacterium TSY]|nr:hypothetical protein [Chloroflexi bacterium TSY]